MGRHVGNITMGGLKKKEFEIITPQSFLFQLQVCASNNSLLPVYFCHTFMECNSVHFFKSTDNKDTGHASHSNVLLFPKRMQVLKIKIA
jgi:hypothetical protein